MELSQSHLHDKCEKEVAQPVAISQQHCGGHHGVGATGQEEEKTSRKEGQ
jgi:hypothetical protein